MLVSNRVIDLKTKKITTETLEMELLVEVDEEGNIKYKHPITRELHRLDGPAAEYSGGDKEWYVEGKLHRLDGPAVEYSDGDREWWINGKHHRLDGPAVEYNNGTKMWFLNGVEYSYEGWLAEVESANRN